MPEPTILIFKISIVVLIHKTEKPLMVHCVVCSLYEQSKINNIVGQLLRMP